MVIPMPSVQISAAPSEAAMETRNWFFLLAFFVSIAGVLQMVALLNIMGGFLTCVVAGIGYYVIRDQSVDMQCMISWGMFAGLQGVMDTVQLIDRVVKLPPGVHVVSMDQPFVQNLIMILVIAGPICELLIAYLVYKVYKKTTDYTVTASGTSGGAVYGSLPTYNTRPAESHQPAQSFSAFAGKGNVLGATN